MGKFDSSEAILDNFGLFTEIFVYIKNPCACSSLSSERVNDTLKLAGFMPLTGFFVTSSTNEAL